MDSTELDALRRRHVQSEQSKSSCICVVLQHLAREDRQRALDAKQAEAKRAEQAKKAEAQALREARAKAEADGNGATTHCRGLTRNLYGVLHELRHSLLFLLSPSRFFASKL